MNEINVMSVRELLEWLPHLKKKYKDSPEWFFNFRFTKEMIGENL